MIHLFPILFAGGAFGLLLTAIIRLSFVLWQSAKELDDEQG